MEGAQGHFAKRNKSDGEKQMPCDLSYMWNQAKQRRTNNRTKVTDTENGLVAASGRLWGVEEMDEVGQKKKKKDCMYV